MITFQFDEFSEEEFSLLDPTEAQDYYLRWVDSYQQGQTDELPPQAPPLDVSVVPGLDAWLEAYRKDPKSVRPPVYIETEGELFGYVIYPMEIVGRLVQRASNPGVALLH